MKRQTLRMSVKKTKSMSIKAGKTSTHASASDKNGGTITLLGKSHKS